LPSLLPAVNAKLQQGAAAGNSLNIVGAGPVSTCKPFPCAFLTRLP
jgi:hypothetical protein